MGVVRTIFVLAVLLLSFAMRIFRLDGQSFWSDEGASVFMTGRNFGEILKAAAGDIHPPLYYLFLRYWSVPVGISEFAVRYLSLIFGVLLVALVFKLGQKLFGRDVGLVAAFIAATSPFLIYYSQEARMYTQMATLSALSVLLAAEVWRRIAQSLSGDPVAALPLKEDGHDDVGKSEGSHHTVGKADDYRHTVNEADDSLHTVGEARRGLPIRSVTQPLAIYALAYILVTSACLYTQYFSFSIVLFENVAFVLVFWRFWRSWRPWLWWIAAQLAVVILYVPWLFQAMNQLTSWPAISDALSLQTLVYRLFLVYSFGLSWDMTTTTKTQVLFGALALVGLLLGWGIKGGKWRENKFSTLNPQSFTLLFLAIPIAVMYYLSLRRPMYNPKFLLLATPPYYILLALGVIGLKGAVDRGMRWIAKAVSPVSHLPGVIGAAIVLLALVGTTFSVSRSVSAYYFDPKYGRDDYRGLARYIEQAGRSGDVIVLNAPGQTEIFGYYYKGSFPVLPLPRQRPIDEKVTEEDLKEAASKYQRIWVVFWAERESDPNGFVERWLNQNTFRASNRWYGSVRLVLYSVPTTTAAGTIQRQVDANLGNKVSLLGYSLNSSLANADYDVKPGEVLQLTLFWQALGAVDERYTVFTHLLDPHEHIWGQRDAEPGSGAKPTTGWEPGKVISDNYGIPIFQGTPPGEYYVEVGLYATTTGQRLQVLGQGGEIKGDRILFGPLRVGKADSPPAIDSLQIEHPSSIDFGPLRLVGYEFYKLGSEAGNVDFRRGDLARLALFWQAKDKPGRDYDIVVQVLDKDGRVVLTKRNPPADGNYPTAQWEKGEVVLDQHKLLLDLPPGKYRLVLGLNDGKGMVKSGQGEFVDLQTLEVK